MPTAPCYQLQGLASELANVRPQGDADALLVALARGDTDALRDVYRRQHEVVRAFARRLLGSDADAEEIVQDVFVELPRAVQRFRGDCTLATFVMSLAVNHARHFMRAAGRRRAAHSRMAEQLDHDAAAPATDDVAEREELARCLLRAMSRLPDEQRLAFVLCEVEERSSSEAARILGVPASTLRSRLGVAKDALRRLLSEEAP
jgi:RNA polymerase sigma-70 factor (ECF subfamily)